jgi:hypothetical protein
MGGERRVHAPTRFDSPRDLPAGATLAKTNQNTVLKVVFWVWTDAAYDRFPNHPSKSPTYGGPPGSKSSVW